MEHILKGMKKQRVFFFKAGTGCISAQNLIATSTEQYLSSPSFPSTYPLYVS